MNRKPGDWDCSSCDHLNFSWRDSCQRCGDLRRGGGFKGRSGDRDEYGSFSRGGGSYGFGSGYKSGGGGYVGDYGRNYGGGGLVGDYGRSYVGGGDYRGGYGGDDYGRNYGGGFGFGSSEVRPGDWFCPARSCGAHNFASRSSCFKCGEEKDEDFGGRGSYESVRDIGYDFGSRGSRGSFGFGSSYSSGGGGGRSGWKSGDWICCRSGCNEHNFASRMECFRCQAPRESGTAV